MLKSLFPTIDWDSVEAVGFDLDGTLYDEFDFIVQVYRPISEIISSFSDSAPASIYNTLLTLWLQHGSSYNRLFSEVLASYSVAPPLLDRAVSMCLEIFRGFQPQLQLSNRVTSLLSHLYDRYTLFVVTDGTDGLQTRKYQSLGLNRWIPPDRFSVASQTRGRRPKPSLDALESLTDIIEEKRPDQIVYFGDRKIDLEFARNAGFQFVPVYNMHLRSQEAL